MAYSAWVFEMKIQLFISLVIVILFLMISIDDSHANPVRTTSISDICSTKTSSVRSVSERTKRDIYRRDGVPGGNHTGSCDGPGGCEVDHILPLELGSSNDADNLKIQPYFGPCNAHHKDKLENRLHRLVCAGEIQVKEAQDLIYNHWIDGYKKFIDAAGCE